MRDHLRTHRLCFRLQGIRNAICASFLLRLLLNDLRVDVFADDALQRSRAYVWLFMDEPQTLVVKRVSSFLECFFLRLYVLYFASWIFNCLDLTGMLN